MEQKEIFVQVALRSWNGQIENADKFFDSISDEQLMKETAPGRNSVIYLLGHLIAVNDRMHELLGAGDRLFADLDEAFILNPDKSGKVYPDAATLRADWRRSKDSLAAAFAKLTPDDWFGRHMSMTDEDLAKDPARNRLSVLLSRTNHLSYHLGQVKLVK